jgi:hypothetical protein
MDKKHNEIGKDVVGRSKTTKASPKCLLKFLKKMNRRSRKMNRWQIREVISDIKNIETNMNVGRSMGNARSLAEFNQSGWIQVYFAPLVKPTTREGMDKSTFVHTQIQIIIIHFLPSPIPPIPNG